MLTAVMLDDEQELLKDVFDVDDVMRTDVNGHRNFSICGRYTK